jgi:glycogen synthase
VAGSASSDSLSRPATRQALRVLVVTPRYLPHIGGVERYVHEVSTRLADAGLEMTVLTTDPDIRSPRSEPSEGVEIVRVRAWPRRRDYYFAPDVYRIVSARNCDLVHVQSYHTFVAPLAMLAARRRGLPYVVTFHAGGHSSRLRRAMRIPQWALLRPLLAHAARLVAIAPFEIDLYSQRLRVPRERFALIPLGTDLGEIAVVSTEEPVVSTEEPTSDPIVASIGRLERYKGHHRLIEALPDVLAAEPNVRVWIGGAGPYEDDLNRLARDLGVADRVDIHAVPASDRSAMARALASVSLVVLLSDYETQPAVALEAIALKRPVLVRDTTGLGDLARQGWARAIHRDSTPAQIAEAVVDELRNPFVPENPRLPTWDDSARSHLEMYRDVCSRAAVPERRVA